MWQDIVLSIANTIFIAALIPAILTDKKPHLITSMATGAAMLLITVSYGSLGLWFSAFMGGTLAAGWFVLAYQRFRMD